jgi:hypothetical protein
LGCHTPRHEHAIDIGDDPRSAIVAVRDEQSAFGRLLIVVSRDGRSELHSATSHTSAISDDRHRVTQLV